MIDLNDYFPHKEVTGDIVIDSLMEYIHQGEVVFQSTYFELKTKRYKIYGAISPAHPDFEIKFKLADNPIMIEYKSFGAVVFRCNGKLYWMTKGLSFLTLRHIY